MTKEKEVKKLTVAEAAQKLKKAEKKLVAAEKRLIDARLEYHNADYSQRQSRLDVEAARREFKEAAIDNAHEKFGIEKPEPILHTYTVHLTSCCG